MSGAGGRSSSSVGTRARTARCTARERRRRRERREQIDRLTRAQHFDGDHVRARAATARSAFSAAAMLMLTWSSLFAEVGIVSTLAGMRERLDLGGERRGGDLRDHQPRLQAAVAREERRQAAQRRIDEPLGPPLADRRELRDRDRQQSAASAIGAP